MERKTLLGLTALLFCMAFLTEHAAARPALEVGARPGSRLAVGFQHSCAIEEDGTVSCWGRNDLGQLGDGSTTDRLVPTAVQGLSNVLAISAGIRHTCALLADGSARCWGNNNFGRLGDGTIINRLTPVAVSGLSNAVAISAGFNHTCALLANGSARCWGSSIFGQLGDGTNTDSLTPVAVSGLSNAVAISAGEFQTCALLANGTASCWGVVDTSIAAQTTPRLQPALSNAVAVAAGAEYGCAVIVDGTVRCWGLNDLGQLGDGTTTRTLLNATTTVSGINTAVAITASFFHTCALLADGSARCWGYNGNGELGDGTQTDTLEPVVVSGLSNAVAISAGEFHTCALISNGSARCWGTGAHGQLGVNSSNRSLIPVSVFGINPVITGKSVAAGGSHSCALRAGSTLACWGDNSRGQLGDGTTTDRLVPSTVFTVINTKAVATGGAHTCALRANGAVSCWGGNQSGQIGDGSLVDRLTPVTVVSSGMTAVATGGNHSCELANSGNVQCWGANSRGQLGNGTTTNSLGPFPVVGVSNVQAITAGGAHTCALLSDGTVRCWGRNDLGQLGDGSTTDRLVPTAVQGLSNVLAISAGGNHTCAVLANGTARCWGNNTHGQLGDGSLIQTPLPSPVRVGSVGGSLLQNVSAIATGTDHTCALLAAGGVQCWGLAFANGSSTDELRPSVVNASPSGALGNITQIATGGSHSCARSAIGEILCWGRNFRGQLGNGQSGPRTIGNTSAGSVSSFTFNIDPNVVIKRDGKKAQVIALANCDAGAHARIHVELRQGNNVGQGQANVECTGALERYPVKVNAHGKDRFVAGAAEAYADAVVRKRDKVIDTQEWTRDVTISVGNFIKNRSHDDD